MSAATPPLPPRLHGTHRDNFTCHFTFILRHLLLEFSRQSFTSPNFVLSLELGYFECCWFRTWDNLWCNIRVVEPPRKLTTFIFTHTHTLTRTLTRKHRKQRTWFFLKCGIRAWTCRFKVLVLDDTNINRCRVSQHKLLKAQTHVGTYVLCRWFAGRDASPKTLHSVIFTELRRMTVTGKNF